MQDQDPSKPIWVQKAEDIHLFIGTPVHSDCSIHYAQALIELQKACYHKKVKIEFSLVKSSLVTQGRNLCVAAFLDSKATHLLFVDSDIDFKSQSIFKMIAKDKDVISIPYPLKNFDWEKGFDKFKNKKIASAKDLAQAFNQYPMKVAEPDNITVNNGVIEVTHSPTGCMLIKRNVLEKMIEKYPHLLVKQKTIINGELVDRTNLYNFFDTLFDPNTNTYHGEDFAFCKRWRDIGGKCHAYINDEISHIGEHRYIGCFGDELILTE